MTADGPSGHHPLPRPCERREASAQVQAHTDAHTQPGQAQASHEAGLISPA